MALQKSKIFRKLLTEIEGFQTFVRILLSLSAFLRFYNVRIRFAYFLASLLFACVVLSSCISTGSGFALYTR